MIYRCDLLPQYLAYKDEIDRAILRVLNSGRYILDREVRSFEREFASYLRVRDVIGVSCGTDALILALKAVGISRGDEVITTAFTAIPTVSAIIAAQGTPVFVDIDRATFLIDLDKIANRISAKTKAIIPVHIFGNVVDVPRLKRLIGSRLPIIEDACQAHGSSIRGRLAGAMGDLSAFSFYPTKNIGGYGDGGALATRSLSLAKEVRLLRTYGMTDADHIIINSVNSRLDELQAAILRVKLKHLNEMNQKRNKIAATYRKLLRKDLFEHQYIDRDVYCNYHICASRFKGDRSKFVKYLDKKNIQANSYYTVPLHLQRANQFLGYKKGDLPETEKLCESAIALPLYPELADKTLEYVIETANKFTGTI